MVINLTVIGAIVMSLTQLIKRLLPGDGKGPYIAAATSLVCVLIWTVSNSPVPLTDPSMWFPVLAAWVAVWQIAGGVYGAANMVTNVGTLTTTTQMTSETTGALIDRSPVLSSPVAAPVASVAPAADTSQSPAGLILPDSPEARGPVFPIVPRMPINDSIG